MGRGLGTSAGFTEGIEMMKGGGRMVPMSGHESIQHCSARSDGMSVAGVSNLRSRHRNVSGAAFARRMATWARLKATGKSFR